MSPAQKIFEWSGSVAMDYGQFRLMVHVGSDNFDDFLDTVDHMAVLNAALDGTGIAQYGPVVTVLSPHQNNFEMRLTIEAWDGPVADDIEAWEEVFEAWLDVDKTGIQYDSPTLDTVAIPVPAGTYRAFIAGRGFVASGWPGSTTPGDSWLVRLTVDVGVQVAKHLAAGQYARSPLGVALPIRT